MQMFLLYGAWAKRYMKGLDSILRLEDLRVSWKSWMGVVYIQPSLGSKTMSLLLLAKRSLCRLPKVSTTNDLRPRFAQILGAAPMVLAWMAAQGEARQCLKETPTWSIRALQLCFLQPRTHPHLSFLVDPPDNLRASVSIQSGKQNLHHIEGI